MAELRWTLEALDWLKDIHHYIAQDNPQAAAKVIDGIVTKTSVRATFPCIGTLLRVVQEGEVRMILYGHYRIAYLCRNDMDMIEILGVFHGALDIDGYIP